MQSVKLQNSNATAIKKHRKDKEGKRIEILMEKRERSKAKFLERKSMFTLPAKLSKMLQAI